jgi:hypothetical protein
MLLKHLKGFLRSGRGQDFVALGHQQKTREFEVEGGVVYD